MSTNQLCLENLVSLEKQQGKRPNFHLNRDFDMTLQNADSKIWEHSPEMCRNFVTGMYGDDISPTYCTQLFPEIVTRWNNHREKLLNNKRIRIVFHFVLFSCDFIFSWPPTLPKLPVSPRYTHLLVQKQMMHS